MKQQQCYIKNETKKPTKPKGKTNKRVKLVQSAL